MAMLCVCLFRSHDCNKVKDKFQYKNIIMAQKSYY